MATYDQVLLPVKHRNWVTPTAIGLLLILRLVVLGLGGWLLKNPPIWLDAVYDTGTYLLTLFLIWWERDRLSEYHIGALAVGIILIFKPLQTLLLLMMGTGAEQQFPMAFPNPFALIVWAASLVTLAWIIKTHPPFRNDRPGEWRWFWMGILAGILTAAVLSFPMAAQIRMTNSMITFQPDFFRLIPLQFVPGFLYQLGYAAVAEEPLFRGFLWGYLRHSGWQDRWIWLFQAGLFMFGHIYYFNRLPYSLWIIVPVAALVLGWMAWRSRSIATSMATHATMNALGMTFGQVVAYWLYR
jgi:membrane protease YdiL (CAAX protease family)